MNRRTPSPQPPLPTSGEGVLRFTGLLTAWKPGYYIAQRGVLPGDADVELTLRPYPAGDNPDYPWIFPHRAHSPPEVDFGCDTCHADVIVTQWEGNAHARSARNPRFLSLYNGTDITGTRVVPPGYVLDFPGTAGNCATCHAPGAAVDAPFTTNMNALTPPESDGVFCDFCHKVGGVYLNPATGLPYPNMPGVLSMDLRRPPAGQQVFFGPYPDVPEPDTYLPLMRQSQFCAPCHAFSFWGTPIYQSFPEWLASPYAEEGVQCQDCHMKPDPTVDHFAAPEKGGFARDPMTIPSHKQPGASDVELLRNTVDMSLTAAQRGSRIQVTVVITNTGAGHHVPTGHPARHMILVVEATDDRGRELTQVGGPMVPEWGGDMAARPGKGFAKVLRDVVTGEEPVASYWKQALIVNDNRIPARQTDISVYSFAASPASGEVEITARLIFRRAFKSLADQKGWNVPDIVMAEMTRSVSLRPTFNAYLSLVAVGFSDR